MIKKIWLWFLNLLWRKTPFKDHAAGLITKHTGRHPDSLPDESVVTRFSGMRNGPQSHLYKGGGGRKRRRKYENGYEVVGAKLRKTKNSGHLFLEGGVRCKRKSDRALQFIQGGNGG